VTTIPTIGFNVESTKFHGITINGWDVGGRSKIRPLLRHYYPETNGLVFVLDSNDRDRMDEVKDQIDILLSEDLLVGLPLLVFANKQDLPNAMSIYDIEKMLDLQTKVHGKRSFLLQPCSATSNKQSLWDGMEWLKREMVMQSKKRSPLLLPAAAPTTAATVSPALMPTAAPTVAPVKILSN
jgi:ADP-ribosylation factor 1/2